MGSPSLTGRGSDRIEAFGRLDHVTKQRVMNDFAPKDTSRGASAAFMGFLKSVVSGGKGGAPTAAMAYAQTPPPAFGYGQPAMVYCPLVSEPVFLFG